MLKMIKNNRKKIISKSPVKNNSTLIKNTNFIKKKSSPIKTNSGKNTIRTLKINFHQSNEDLNKLYSERTKKSSQINSRNIDKLESSKFSLINSNVKQFSFKSNLNVKIQTENKKNIENKNFILNKSSKLI